MKNWRLTGLLILVSTFSFAEIPVTNGSAVANPDQGKKLAEIQGKIESLNTSSRQVTIKDKAGQTVTVIAVPDIRVMDSENRTLAWTDLRQGDHVLAYYDTASRHAFQIDRRPSVGDTLMGNPPR